MDGIQLSLQSCRGDSLLFTTESPGGPGTHFIDLREMKLAQRPCLICSLKTKNI